MAETDDRVRTVACFEAAVAQARAPDVDVDDDACAYALQGAHMEVAWPLVAPLALDARASLRELAATCCVVSGRRHPSLVEPVMERLASRLSVESEPSALVAIVCALGEIAQTGRVELRMSRSGSGSHLVTTGALSRRAQ